MSLSQLIEEHATSVFLNTDHFAQTVLRYIGGDSANVRQVTAIVTLHPTVADDSRGRGYIHRADMVLSSDIQVTASDAFKIGDLRYEVEHPGDPEHGMRTVGLIRYQPEAKGAKPIRNGDF